MIRGPTNGMQVCELPLMVGYSLSKRLGGEAMSVTKDAFMQFWTSRQLMRAPLVDKVFHCFRQEGQEVGTGRACFGSLTCLAPHPCALFTFPRYNIIISFSCT